MKPILSIALPKLMEKEQFKIVTEMPEGERCVSMIQFKEFIYLATEKHVYRLVDDKLEPVHFLIKEQP